MGLAGARLTVGQHSDIVALGGSSVLMTSEKQLNVTSNSLGIIPATAWLYVVSLLASPGSA